MRSQQQLYLMCQPHARARAAAQVQKQSEYRITVMVAFALASAISMLWMAYLLTLTGGIPTNSNIAPTHLSSASESGNRGNKDDRLTSVRFDDRWNAFATTIHTLGENGVHARAADPAKDIQRIPVGCEAAFGHLVKNGNFSARCLASADINTRLAKVE